MKALKWLTNMSDPREAGHYVPRAFDETPQQALAGEQEFLKGKIIGKPRAGRYSVEELEALGMVGIYVEVESE